MKLFKLTKTMPQNWFNDVHKAITEAQEHSDINKIRDGLEQQREDFFLSHRDDWATCLLIAYCSLRYRFLTHKINLDTKKRTLKITK